MKYVNQTKWFHKDGVPTAEVMHASMTSGPSFKGILSVTWWQIDSHIQGSIIIYESEELKNITDPYFWNQESLHLLQCLKKPRVRC